MKIIDLTNQHFGKLVVLKRDTNKTNGTYWLCQCDCGNIISVRKDQLTRKKYPKRSCGCDFASKSSAIHLKDETGNIYGKLTVLHRVPDIRPGEARWLCQCECGNLCEVSGIHLRNGSVQSCGCLRYDSRNGIDETGNRYGKLLVLYRSPKTDGTHIYWHCKCDCGNECDINGTHLRTGISTHCGCERSAGETKIQSLLQKNGINYQREYVFKDLIGSNGGYLRFDFAIFNTNGTLSHLIEYDGVQHFDQRCFNQSNEEFTLLKKHDIMKTEYCKAHNIRLIRIRYTQLQNIQIDDIL